MLRIAVASVWLCLLIVITFKCKTTNDSTLKGPYEPILANVRHISCSSAEAASRSTRLAIHLADGIGADHPAVVLGFIHAPQHDNGVRLSHATLAKAEQLAGADGTMTLRYRFTGWTPAGPATATPTGVNYQLTVVTMPDDELAGVGTVDMEGEVLADGIACKLVPGPATPSPHRWLKQQDGSFLAHASKDDSDMLFAMLPGKPDETKTYDQLGLTATCDYLLAPAAAVQSTQCHLTYPKGGEVIVEGTALILRTVSRGKGATPLWNLLGKTREKVVKGGKERTWTAAQTPFVIHCTRLGGVSKTECHVEGRFEG